MELEINEQAQEDFMWQESQKQDLIEIILEETWMKHQAITMEQSILSKRQALQSMKKEQAPLEPPKSIRINQYQKLCLYKLQERIQYLTERAEKIRSELDLVRNTQSDPAMLQLMEEILDLIHTNQLLERFIQSENFRASQDQILYLKHKFLQL